MTNYSDTERQLLRAASDFNRLHPSGTWVSYRPGRRTEYGQTTGQANVVGAGPFMRAIVWLDGHNDGIDLADISVLPGQPDAIEDDSRELPDPVKAANRVGEYIAANGDGIYDVIDGHPLYARDLEALRQFAEAGVTA